MPKQVCVIDGHPDGSGQHYVDAICDAYARGAEWGGHTVSRINVGQLEFACLRSAGAFDALPPDPVLVEREKILAADHIVVAYPLWMGGMPAYLKAFLEVCACNGFMLGEGDKPNAMPQGRMKGKSVRLIVTMGMPGIFFKLVYGAHSLKGAEIGIFRIAGFGPIRHSIFGMIEGLGAQGRARILKRVERLGERAV